MNSEQFRESLAKYCHDSSWLHQRWAAGEFSRDEYESRIRDLEDLKRAVLLAWEEHHSDR